LEKHVEIVDGAVGIVVQLNPVFLGLYFFEDRLRLGGVVPEIGVLGTELFVFDFFEASVDVKETSSGPQRGSSNPLIDRLSSSAKITTNALERVLGFGPDIRGALRLDKRIVELYDRTVVVSSPRPFRNFGVRNQGFFSSDFRTA